MSNLKIQGNAGGAGTPTLQSGNTSNSVTFSLPIADGTSGQALTTDGSGVLSFASVGTDASNITSGTLAVARGGTGVTTSTGSGNTVLSTSPTLVTPVLGTPSSGNLDSCTADGTNKVGYRNIPNSGAKTTAYTLVATDVGKFIELGTGGSVVVPASVFAAGDAISIFNNTSASISCTCSAVTTVYKGGTDADISSFSVTTRGVATILFITATTAVVTGNLA
jgi:hypothetical protein